jgi:hypothetical protein
MWFDALEDNLEGEEIFLDADFSEVPSSISEDEVESSEEEESDEVDGALTTPPAVYEIGPNAIVSSPTAEVDSLVVRRTILPAPISGDEGSLFAALKKNIGKVCLRVLASLPY